MTIPNDALVGHVATEHPLSTRVFARHAIDFCCGGGRPLEEVCRDKGLDPARIIKEIEREIAVPDTSAVRWDEEPLDALINHILSEYHVPLYEELPRLEAMARKVHQVHGGRDPERLKAVLTNVVAIRNDLEQHMSKEEQILFPMIRSGQGAMAAGPIEVMQHEHETVGELLRRLRAATDGYRVPEGACNTWRALWHGLAAMETSLHEHIHLENNILFPRVLGD